MWLMSVRSHELSGAARPVLRSNWHSSARSAGLAQFQCAVGLHPLLDCIRRLVPTRLTPLRDAGCVSQSDIWCFDRRSSTPIPG
jgi:hypothetical protein